MGQAIPRQHPAVVLRSQFNQLRALLAVAMIAVVGLSVAVVILASESDEVSSTSALKPIESINYGDSNRVNPSTGYPMATTRPDAGVRPDGGPEEGTSGATTARQPNVLPGVRPDGGPEEGISGATSARQPNVLPGVRPDGGPEEGTSGATTAHQPTVVPGTRPDGGPEEGIAEVSSSQPRVTEQRAFPGLSDRASSAQSEASQHQSGAKDYSMNGATGDYADEPQAQSGSRADGEPDEDVNLRAALSGAR